MSNATSFISIPTLAHRLVVLVLAVDVQKLSVHLHHRVQVERPDAQNIVQRNLRLLRLDDLRLRVDLPDLDDQRVSSSASSTRSILLSRMRSAGDLLDRLVLHAVGFLLVKVGS